MNGCNVKNSITLANDLVKMKLHENCRLRTFDIKDLYVNIPFGETLDITKHLLSKPDKHVTKQMLTPLHNILQQNCFTFQDIFQPDNGIAMGSPFSRIITEIFLPSLKDTHLKQQLKVRSIIFCTRYVDIFVIYNRNKTTPQNNNNTQLHERTSPKFKIHPHPRTEQ
jgi:hypothetical protein